MTDNSEVVVKSRLWNYDPGSSRIDGVLFYAELGNVLTVKQAYKSPYGRWIQLAFETMNLLLVDKPLYLYNAALFPVGSPSLILLKSVYLYSAWQSINKVRIQLEVSPKHSNYNLADRLSQELSLIDYNLQAVVLYIYIWWFDAVLKTC